MYEAKTAYSIIIDIHAPLLIVRVFFLFDIKCNRFALNGENPVRIILLFATVYVRLEFCLIARLFSIYLKCEAAE